MSAPLDKAVALLRMKGFVEGASAVCELESTVAKYREALRTIAWMLPVCAETDECPIPAHVAGHVAHPRAQP